MPLDFKQGQILLLNKPYAWTSFDLVRKIKYLLKKLPDHKNLKIGHAGTLDPLATGLLIVCTGKKTKEISKIQELPKEYIAELFIGATTPSYDRETEINSEFNTEHITREMVTETLAGFIGPQMQVPPVFSAKWINGKRAYESARNGSASDSDLPASAIVIYEMELLEWSMPIIKIRVLCSKGTYIRALARDIGQKLNSGSFLNNLVRTRIGEHCVDKALEVNELNNLLIM